MKNTRVTSANDQYRYRAVYPKIRRSRRRRAPPRREDTYNGRSVFARSCADPFSRSRVRAINRNGPASSPDRRSTPSADVCDDAHASGFWRTRKSVSRRDVRESHRRLTCSRAATKRGRVLGGGRGDRKSGRTRDSRCGER